MLGIRPPAAILYTVFTDRWIEAATSSAAINWGKSEVAPERQRLRVEV